MRRWEGMVGDWDTMEADEGRSDTTEQATLEREWRGSD